MTYEELVAAGAKPVDAPAGGGLTFEQLTALGATPVTDMGPEARAAHPVFGRPKMPEPKTDDELGIDRGPQFGQLDSRPVFGRDAPGTREYAMHHAGDEMNDPGAQLITGAALAAPGAALVGAAAPAAAAPLLSGAAGGAQQAAMMEQNPLVGAALGAIPGVPGAARAGLNAAEAAAFTRATSPGFGGGPGPVARAAGKLTGMAVGSTHGPLGLLVGHDLGGRAAILFSKAGDAATSALARRYVDRQLGAIAPRAPMVDLSAERNTGQLNFHAPRATGFAADAPPIPNRIPLAPLVSEGPILPTEAPPGFDPYVGARRIGPNEFDTFDEPGSPANNHATRGDQTAVERHTAIDRDTVVDEPKTLVEDSGDHASIIRNAGRFRHDPYDIDEPGAIEPAVESQLARSVRMLSELKSAARAGKVSTTMIQEALSAGMSPQAVAKTVGREAFERATAK